MTIQIQNARSEMEGSCGSNNKPWFREEKSLTTLKNVETCWKRMRKSRIVQICIFLILPNRDWKSYRLSGVHCTCQMCMKKPDRTINSLTGLWEDTNYLLGDMGIEINNIGFSTYTPQSTSYCLKSCLPQEIKGRCESAFGSSHKSICQGEVNDV